MAVGILALQGAFAEHAAVLDKLGVPHFEIRQKRDLDQPMNGLIIPGGESTVMNKLLRELDLYDTLREQIQNGLPVFGTYGRQLGSFFTDDRFGGSERIPMTFIRAPYIESVGNNVEVLSIVDSNIVAAQQDNMLVTAFHPELDEDLTVHQHFIRMVEQFRLKNAG